MPLLAVDLAALTGFMGQSSSSRKICVIETKLVVVIPFDFESGPKDGA